jgi:hypothetical protein
VGGGEQLLERRFLAGRCYRVGVGVYIGGLVHKFPPFFASDDEATRAYIACGKIALNWGPIELAIEGFVILLRHRHRALVSDEMPLIFSRKVKSAKALLKLDPANADILDAIRPLLGRAKELHAIRVDVVHCLCQGTNLDGEMMFGKSDQKRGVAYTETRHTIAQIESAADDMRSLRAALEPLFTTLRTRS